MTAKELLMPRFEVIAEYPKSTFKVGDTLVRVKNATDDWYDVDENAILGNLKLQTIEQYPHLFRKLNWWEKREAKDMPIKLICKATPDDKEVCIVQEWDMELLVGFADEKKREGYSLTIFNPVYGYFPID